MSIQKFLFRHLSLETYLRLLQRSYFLLYKIGILRWSKAYMYHYYVRKLIKHGDTVLDIGANLGYYSILFAKWVGRSGHVYSVEPIQIYNQIFNEKARRYGNITLYPYALGQEEKTIQMVSSPNVGYLRTGLPHVYDAQTDGALEKVEFRFDAEMKIPSKLFAPLSRIDYIKCDVEGFEQVILSDMKNIIAQHKPKVQVEVWEGNEVAVTGLFQAMGYVAYKLVNKRLVRVQEIPCKIDGDYIFIHNDDADSKKS